MIELSIPGFGPLCIEHVVCDYNGTLAVDGKLLPGAAEQIEALSRTVEVHVVTADTFQMAKKELEHLPCRVTVLPESGQDSAKRDYVSELGPKRTVCIGNGRNDRLMLEQAVVGIALVQEEGASAEALQHADVVCRSVRDALDLLRNPKRLTATLRT